MSQNNKSGEYSGPVDRRSGDTTGQFASSLLLIDMGRRITKLEDGVESQSRSLDENTRLTRETAASINMLEENLSGAVKFFKAMDGTITISAMVGKFAKWVTIIGAACALLWLLVKFVIIEALKGDK